MTIWLLANKAKRPFNARWRLQVRRVNIIHLEEKWVDKHKREKKKNICVMKRKLFELTKTNN